MPERELDEARAVRHNGATDAEFEAAGIMNPGPRSSRLQSRMVYDCPSPSHPPPPADPTHPASRILYMWLRDGCLCLRGGKMGRLGLAVSWCLRRV